MEKNIYKLLVLFIGLFLTSLISSAQEKRCITEIYSVEKSQSKSYARELEVYLKVCMIIKKAEKRSLVQ